MKKTIYLFLVAFLIVLGCSKVANVPVVSPEEPQLKSAKIGSPVLTATPITPWATPGAITIWDNNVGVLNTALFTPPSLGPLPNYSFTQLPNYDFSPYFKINGGTEYNPTKYDLMAHFGYISPKAVSGAVVEFTFTHIKYFLPHMNNINQQRIYTVNHEDHEYKKDDEGEDDETVITCTTDLVQGMNPMFCFLVKVDCGKDERSEKVERDHGKVKSSLTTFWTDMKVNGVSVKGTIKNKVYACN